MPETTFVPAEFEPTDRAAYAQWTTERVRFGDLDPLGHVNNNLFGVYFETARLGFFDATRLHEEANAGTAIGAPREATVVVRITIEFLAELGYPADLEIGTRLTGLGGSSFTYRQALFAGATCHALAETVSVLFDLGTRRPKPLSEAQRARLIAFS
ncbi:MAG: thioesterase family protein [Azospirillaceae bacterium]